MATWRTYRYERYKRRPLTDPSEPSAILPAMPTDANRVTIYADGAASTNPGAGGYGVVLLSNGQRKELSGGFRRTTNNRMELMGAMRTR